MAPLEAMSRLARAQRVPFASARLVSRERAQPLGDQIADVSAAFVDCHCLFGRLSVLIDGCLAASPLTS
jgi:hypothetical protein